ncbi:NEK11 [Acanthosepion pharaonis]|uniref:non-specific serine/threonine protein kinase n=1 Tax=Acanthosepion pharaonis TaxID=158019 RepID=A0A812E170_ACAPH|nr:NEK11 [Sepia pharaonis]
MYLHILSFLISPYSFFFILPTLSSYTFIFFLISPHTLISPPSFFLLNISIFFLAKYLPTLSFFLSEYLPILSFFLNISPFFLNISPLFLSFFLFFLSFFLSFYSFFLNISTLFFLKEIPVGGLQPNETVVAEHEARLLSQLSHPNIVKFLGKFIDREFFCIITEYCEGGDLDKYIEGCQKKKQPISEKRVLDWFVQLLLGVDYIHARRILHRDLKSRNIFLQNEMIKIGDFGISRILMGPSDYASTFIGTPYYMSPEVLKHEGYNSKSDIWSLGCILFDMCALKHAFESTSFLSVLYKITDDDPPSLPSHYPIQMDMIFKL